MQVALAHRATPACSPARCQRAPGVARPARRAMLLVRAAKDEKDDMMAGVIKTASGLVDRATDLVPADVPRPAAKAGVAIAGVMIVFWVLQKAISGVVTLVVLGGLGYYFLTKQGGSDDDNTIDVKPTSSSSSSKKGKAGGADMDDPLAEARKIMDKYK